MNHDEMADDLAHDRFQADFNKLFGAKPALRKGVSVEVQRLFPSPALRKEYADADEGGRILMLMEMMLENLASPVRAERGAKLAKIHADRADLRKQIGDIATEVLGVAALVDRVAGEAASRSLTKSAASAARMTQLAADLTKSAEQILSHVQGGADLAKAGQSTGRGVGESANLPFSRPVNFTIN